MSSTQGYLFEDILKNSTEDFCQQFPGRHAADIFDTNLMLWREGYHRG